MEIWYGNKNAGQVNVLQSHSKDSYPLSLSPAKDARTFREVLAGAAGYR